MTQSANRRSKENRRWWLPPMLLALAAGIVYSNIFHCPFVFDSRVNIQLNPAIDRFWPAWDWLTHSQRPVVYFTFVFNRVVLGDWLPGYHLVNLLIHIAAATVLFALLRRTLTQSERVRRYASSANGLAFAIALLWLVHPLQTQSVTYTIQRMEALMGLFYLLTLYTFVRAQSSNRSLGWYALSIGFCGLGAGTKEVIVSAPLIVLWFDRVFMAKNWSEIWRRRFYYVGLFASYLPLAFLMTSWARYGEAAGRVKGVSSIEYALSQPGVILHYLRLSIWPIGQCLDYGWPISRTAGQIVIPALVILGLLAATLWSISRRPLLGFLGGWFFLILAPTSSIVPIRDLAFEHRMYLPLATICVIAVFLFYEGSLRLEKRYSLTNASRRRLAGIVLSLAVLLLSSLTYQRNLAYRSEISIWSDVVRKAPHHARGHFQLGFALATQRQFAGAIRSYEETLRLEPKFIDANFNLGTNYEQLNQTDKAVEHYEAEIRIDPNHAMAHNNLGTIFASRRDFERALRHFEAGLNSFPDSPALLANLGGVCLEQQQTDKAVMYLADALELDPHNHRIRSTFVEAHCREAQRQMGRDDLKEAERHLAEALQVLPTDPQIHFEMGVLYTKMGRREQAARHYREALRVRPDYAEARENLGRLMGQ